MLPAMLQGETWATWRGRPGDHPEPGPEGLPVHWRRTLLVALPVAILAFLMAALLEGPSAQEDGYDRIAYPVFISVLVLLEIALAIRPRSLRPVVMAIVASASAFFLGKLVNVLFIAGDPGSIQKEMTESFFWIPVLYVLAGLVPGVRGGRFIALLFTGFVLLGSATHLVLAPYGSDGAGSASALIQLNLANSVMLALTFAFIGFKERYTREHGRLEIAQRSALTDPLTGLPNLRSAEVALKQMLAQASVHKAPLALFTIDLDRFKIINDTLGHGVGDELLVQLAQRFAVTLRAEDLVARMSSDEFIVLARGVAGQQEAERIANRIFAAVAEPFDLGEAEMAVTVSIGVAFFPQDGRDPETLLRRADSAMYTVKRSGKNGLRFFTEASEGPLQRRRELERDLRDALEKQQLTLHYQPMYELDSGDLVKVEALLRWDHPELGTLTPGDFIPVAEESGLIVSIGSWALHEACRQLRSWQLAGVGFFRLAVNISPLQFSQATFLDTVLSALGGAGLEPGYLELELTENLLTDRVDDVAGLLRKLRSLGITIAIDDFGIGNSSLANLRDLPIDCLKVDRSLIKDLSGSDEVPPFTLALIEAMTGLASHLRLQLVAEGVEESNQCVLLQRLGFHIGQGYWFARPMAGPEFEAMIRPARHLPGEERLRLVN